MPVARAVTVNTRLVCIPAQSVGMKANSTFFGILHFYFTPGGKVAAASCR